MPQTKYLLSLSAVKATLTPCPNAAILMDWARFVTHVNPAFEAEYSENSALAVGRCLDDVLTREDSDKLLTFISMQQTSWTPTDLTCQLIEGDLEITFSAVASGRDAPVIFVGYLRSTRVDDAVVVKEPTDTLDLEHMQRLSAAMVCSNQGVWDIWNPNAEGTAGKSNYASSSWYAMRGYDPSDQRMQQANWHEHVHPDDLARVEAIHQSQELGEIDEASLQYRFRHADGHWIWILSRGRVLWRDKAGLPARIVGTDTDITSLNESETSLLDMESRLQMAIQAYKIGVWEFNSKLGMVKWDARMREMYGITDDEDWRPADEFPKFLHPEDREYVIEHSRECLEHGTDFVLDYRILGSDGEVRYMRSRATNQKDENTGDIRLLGVNMDITEDVQKSLELETARATLEYESCHDALTGLANRRGLDQYHQRNFDLAKGKPPLSVVLHLDLDQFKQINDNYGHAAGDAVLVHVGRELRRLVGPDGLVSRHGGDEFVIMLPVGKTLENAARLSNDILTCFREPYVWNGNTCRFGVSIGIAQCSAEDKNTTDVFVNADLALYAAKRAGRNCMREYNPALREDARLQRSDGEAITRALTNNEIDCLFQPQFDAKTRRLVGFDAAARWNSEQHGLLTPPQFMSTLENQGLVTDFDIAVLQAAIAHQRRWFVATGQLMPVSVDISSQLALDPALIDRLAAFDLSGGKISFQLLAKNYAPAEVSILRKNLDMLRGIGLGIEIRKFGTETSSIVSLLDIAPARVQIDQKLIQSSLTSNRRKQVVGSLVQVAATGGAEVIADGISSQEQALIATDLGCTVLQGYGLGRCVDSETAQAMLCDLIEDTQKPALRAL